jgi:glutaredoxin
MKKHDIVLFTHPGCPGGNRCKQFMIDKHLQFTEKDIAKDVDARKEFQVRGFLATPIIMIDHKILFGFDPFEFSTYLNHGEQDKDEE